MKISLNTRIASDVISPADGYGYATERMLASLRNLGYEVNDNDPGADVGLVFDQPQHARYFPSQYNILYHPWESTLLLNTPKHRDYLGRSWVETMNSVDEVWTPSPLIAQWYQEYAGITTPVYVYEHGVDSDIWTPDSRRGLGEGFKFLHVGAESARKGWKELSQSFRAAFPQKRFKDVSLTYKVIKKPPVPALPGTQFVDGNLSIKELVELFHAHHVYVYPSWGEGFGLTPLQAMATGMPTITSRVWAPYKDFLDENLSIGGSLVNSPWPSIHPGYMIKPDTDELVERMRWVEENYEMAHVSAMADVAELTDYYSWDRLTQQAFSALEKRLETH